MRLREEIYERYKKNNGWVYLVHAEGTPRYKIGRSINPSVRLSQLQGQSPYPLVIKECVWTPDAIDFEQSLHEEFHKNRVFGEWFEFIDHPDFTNTIDAYDRFCWYGRKDIQLISQHITELIIDSFYQVKPFCYLDSFSEVYHIVKRTLAISQCLEELVCIIDFLVVHLIESWIHKSFNICPILNEHEHLLDSMWFCNALQDRINCFIYGLTRGENQQ
ncbi:GIY-YIG nuclease family protein [Anabaena sp. CCY 9910]|uniref:GIY-YIG nuclease family protein n=1 Tax=Anabaena sp. CCY 9910 TaxID=3103870 RepID=UPI0039E102EB